MAKWVSSVILDLLALQSVQSSHQRGIAPSFTYENASLAEGTLRPPVFPPLAQQCLPVSFHPSRSRASSACIATLCRKTANLRTPRSSMGNNGVGKSTLLRLAFHLLSAASDRGHRTALYKTDFRQLEVALASGVRLTAKAVHEKPAKLLLLEVYSLEKKLAVWEYRPGGEGRFFDEDVFIEADSSGRHVVRRRITSRRKELDDVPRGEQAYLAALKEHVPTLFILNADRRLDSDSVADPSDEVEL